MHSSFLRLSPELRNLIYEYALTAPQHAGILATEPPLTRTCRRIREESLMLYYTLNNFYLDVPQDRAYNLSQNLPSSDLSTPNGRQRIEAMPKLIIIYHLSPMENIPASLGEDSKAQGGWTDLAEALARLGFAKDQVEWQAVSDTRFSHPALGGNYYRYLAETARVGMLGELMRKGWEEAVGTEEGERKV